MKQEVFRQIADKSFTELVNKSFLFEKHVIWLTHSGQSKENVCSNLPINLYNGIAGVLLFLNQYNNLVNSKITSLYYFNTINSFLLKVKTDMDKLDVGFYDGLSGLLFILDKIKNDIDPTSYQSTRQQIIANLTQKVQTTKRFDIINGLAGVIASSILYANDDDEIQNIVKLSCKRLKQLSTSHKDYVYYKRMNGVPLGGFSHGASGVAYAMLLNAEKNKDEESIHFAEQNLKYEFTLYDAKENNFLDKRSETPKFCNFWCHGYPGINIAFCKAFDLTLNDKYQQFINRYIDHRLLADVEKLTGWSICHGYFGNFSITDFVLQKHGNRAISAEYARLKDSKTNTYINNYQNTTTHGFVPGLMTGISGIGLYALSRLTDQDVVSRALLIN